MKKVIHRISKFIAPLAILLILFTSACNCRKSSQNQEKELIATDSLFSEMSADKGMKNAFLAYLDTNAVLLRSNHRPIEGIAAIKKYFAGFSDSSFILTWKPLKAIISSNSTMGFTYGIYRITDKITGKSNGNGTYITIWQKDNKGKWKAVSDTGNEGLGDTIQ
jgi:ketosteroid isomerase-like protein